MNLSCGNCKSIQGFSGEPLKCDACGWVSGAQSTESKNRHYKLKKTTGEHVQDAFGGFVKIAIILTSVLVMVRRLTPEKQQLAEQYHISKDAVFIEPKPHGCDFDDAPLGNKHCHYEKVIDADKACAGLDCRVKAVYVSWRKLSD